jgi:hypothetical protein
MTYTKPELSVLGNATELILGSPTSAKESNGNTPGSKSTDCDLDD